MASKSRTDMTPAQLDAARAYDRTTRPSRAAAGAQPHRKLTDLERWHIAILDALDLWSRTRIAAAYGVHRRTVQHCTDRHALTRGSVL